MTNTQWKLYEAYASGSRGLSSTAPQRDVVIGTFVLALYQTMGGEFFVPVTFFVAKPIETEVTNLIKATVGYIFTARKGLPTADTKVVYEAIQKITFGSRVLQVGKAPDRWVAIGFDRVGISPDWMKGALCQIQ